MESTGALSQGRTGSLSPSFHVIIWNPDGTWESLEEVPGDPGQAPGPAHLAGKEPGSLKIR